MTNTLQCIYVVFQKPAPGLSACEWEAVYRRVNPTEALKSQYLYLQTVWYCDWGFHKCRAYGYTWLGFHDTIWGWLSGTTWMLYWSIQMSKRYLALACVINVRTRPSFESLITKAELVSIKEEPHIESVCIESQSSASKCDAIAVKPAWKTNRSVSGKPRIRPYSVLMHQQTFPDLHDDITILLVNCLS